MTIIIPSTRAWSQQLLSRSHQILARVSISCKPLLRVKHSLNATTPSSTSHHDYSSAYASSIQARSYATGTPGRPKAHTGRTTTATKKATTSKSGAQAKPGRKPAPKKKAKAKPKPKPKPKKKPLTQAGLKAQEVKKAKELKEVALLHPPKKLPETAWTVMLSEAVRKDAFSADTIKGTAQRYKSLPADEHQQYNHTANENKAKNVAEYKRWISTYTPSQIKAANNARTTMRQQAKKAGKKTRFAHIKDERLVKQPISAYAYFLQSRIASGDMKGMKIAEVGPLLGSEWKVLRDGEKKEFTDMAAKDRARYQEEYKSVYGVDVPSLKAKKT